MKVSIIIPIYKVEDYINKCLESVLSQSYRNLEVILVDDASPDNSLQIARRTIDHLGNPDINIVYITHKKNRGLSAARNTGIAAATGDYLYFLDSDDELYDSKAISILVEGAIETNADVIVGNNYVQRNTNPYTSKYRNKSLSDMVSAFVKDDVPVMAWNKLIRRSLFDNGLKFK